MAAPVVGSRYSLAALLVALTTLVAACETSPRMPSSLEGRIADALTGGSIAGAVVRVERHFACRGFNGPRPDFVPPAETTTDASGRFAVGLKPIASSWCSTYFDRYMVIAPGYLPSPVFLAPETRLDPVQYDVERAVYERDATVARQATAGGLYASAWHAARATAFRPAGLVGVFASAPGRTLGPLAITRVGFGGNATLNHRFAVLAQDRASGEIHVWTTRGEPVTVLPASAGTMVGLGPGGYPLLHRPGGLWIAENYDARLSEVRGPLWASVAPRFSAPRFAVAGWRQLVTVEQGGGRDRIVVYDHHAFNPGRPQGAPPARVASGDLADLIQPGVIECMAFRRAPGSGAVEPITAVLFVVRTSDERQLLTAAVGGPSVPVSVPSGGLDEAVTACAASQTALYLALASGGLRKLSFVQGVSPQLHAPDPPLTAVRIAAFRGPGLAPSAFTALAVGPMGRVSDSPWEAVYAVAGDGHVYRFDEELAPDHRVVRE
jgi:hypothetical protein